MRQAFRLLTLVCVGSLIYSTGCTDAPNGPLEGSQPSSKDRVRLLTTTLSDLCSIIEYPASSGNKALRIDSNTVFGQVDVTPAYGVSGRLNGVKYYKRWAGQPSWQLQGVWSVCGNSTFSITLSSTEEWLLVPWTNTGSCPTGDPFSGGQLSTGSVSTNPPDDDTAVGEFEEETPGSARVGSGRSLGKSAGRNFYYLVLAS